jgi:hypothetical protein
MAQAVAVARTSGAGGSDMSERIGPRVAEETGVGRAADAEGIQNEEKCARHLSPGKLRLDQIAEI